MHNFLKKGLSAVRSVADKASEELTSGYTLVKEKVNGLPIFMSAEQSGNYDDTEYDEKHYFVIPYELSDYKFALHTMRCLPNGVPEINNLPKKRIFHFPNEHSEEMLKGFMRQSAETLVRTRNDGKLNSLESLANQIDLLDKKLTYGMLLVGGLAAIVNPLLGAGIAAKALIPSVGGLLNRYGLRPTGEKLSQYQLDKSIKEAEAHIAKEFEGADTLQVINPILQELEFALRTTQSQHDPLTDPSLADGSIKELDDDRWRELTEKAICHVYKEVYEDSRLHKQASLGPEDLRWLQTLFYVHDRNN
ncbi:hypothetical protein Q4575_00060 [Psychrosphaera sp. 1_MG-2023]|uniref:hypothetical protein n=1 Tax=unclassified Psychrosphaera TaxID=2641570 RepID=UPI002091915C|nr:MULTISPECIES: hypothetical protein [unclassified Psychrosphaera]MDO6717769.1 hypothetical protein [Psychrosphaera sp. 1_MG-2023]